MPPDTATEAGSLPWNYQIGYAAMPGKECLSGLTEQVEAPAFCFALVEKRQRRSFRRTHRR